jgi:hypothetical protein
MKYFDIIPNHLIPVRSVCAVFQISMKIPYKEIIIINSVRATNI